MSSAPDRSAAVVVIPAWGLAALGLLAAVANANFLLRRPVGSSFDPVTSEISLLSVAGQPGAWAFRAADTAAGLAAVLLALASAAVTTNFRGSRRVYGRLLAVSLGAFGIGTVASAIVTLSCAMSAQCVASPARDSVHDALSVVATLGTVVGCILLLRLRAGRASRGAVAGEALLAAAVTGLAALQVIYWLGGLPGGQWVGAARSGARDQHLVRAGRSPPGPLHRWRRVAGILDPRRPGTGSGGQPHDRCAGPGVPDRLGAHDRPGTHAPPADHRPPDHRPPDHRPPDHRPPDHRHPDHRPPDHRPPDHRPPDGADFGHEPGASRGRRAADATGADRRHDAGGRPAPACCHASLGSGG